MSRRGEHGFDGNKDRRTCCGRAANEFVDLQFAEAAAEIELLLRAQLLVV